MTTIADLRSARTGFNDVADLLEGIETDISTIETDLASNALYVDSGTSTQSTTSTSPVALADTDMSIIIATGEAVLLNASFSFSNDTVNKHIRAYIYRDSTALTGAHWGETVTATTNGVSNSISLTAIDSPSAGTYTYQVYWSVNSGTGYATTRRITALKLKV